MSEITECCSVLQCVFVTVQHTSILSRISLIYTRLQKKHNLACCTVTNTHCNTLQHTAPHFAVRPQLGVLLVNKSRCNTLQHAATHCNTLQHTTAYYNTPCDGFRDCGKPTIWHAAPRLKRHGPLALYPQQLLQKASLLDPFPVSSYNNAYQAGYRALWRISRALSRVYRVCFRKGGAAAAPKSISS